MLDDLGLTDLGFQWDKEKYRQVVKKHQVRFYEVISVFDDPKGFETAGPEGHWERWIKASPPGSEATAMRSFLSLNPVNEVRHL